MRAVVEQAGDRPLDTTDGVRVTEEGRGWVLVLPDPSGALTHLWAEGDDDDAAQSLLDEWGGVVGRAAAR
jgi:mannose-1-phosphate guanylyltransferase/phosphomannomutase